MHIGFTGTQKGMNDNQLEMLGRMLLALREEDELDGEMTIFHHGDCIGADAQAHTVAQGYGLHVVIHPPSIDTKRAFCAGDIRVPLPYLERNRNIVDECDILLVAPKTNKEELRSGTWATYRYAMKLDKAVILLER